MRQKVHVVAARPRRCSVRGFRLRPLGIGRLREHSQRGVQEPLDVLDTLAESDDLLVNCRSTDWGGIGNGTLQLHCLTGASIASDGSLDLDSTLKYLTLLTCFRYFWCIPSRSEAESVFARSIPRQFRQKRSELELFALGL